MSYQLTQIGTSNIGTYSSERYSSELITIIKYKHLEREIGIILITEKRNKMT